MNRTYWDNVMTKQEKRLVLSFLFLLKTKNAKQIEDEGWITGHQLDQTRVQVSRLPRWLYTMTPDKLALEVTKYGGPFKWI